jgi:transposase
MYLRTTRRKNKDGSEAVYYQLAETIYSRENRRPEAHIIHNFGRADEVDTEALKRLARSILRVCEVPDVEALQGSVDLEEVFGYGVLLVAEVLWEELGIGPLLRRIMGREKRRSPHERILMALTANRLDDPTSKLGCYEQWLPQGVWLPEAASWKLEQLYRSMDFLLKHIKAVEEEVFNHVVNLFNADVDLIFYDTTSLYFEIDEEDPDGYDPETRMEQKGLRKRGHNKEGRDGNPQIVVGLAVTRDGLPVKSWVFPGSTNDVSTIARIREDLRGWRLNRTVLVGDAGMFSADNQKLLAKGHGRYILAVPMRKVKEVKEEVLTRPGRYKVVKENLEVKEVKVGDGACERRYILCLNHQEAEREARHRATLLENLAAELAALDARDEDHPKKACELLASKRYGRYLKQDGNHRLQIDQAKVRNEAKLDGKYVLITNDDTMSPEDVALGYKAAMVIEGCFRRMKTTGLRTRPIFHWTRHRIEAHVKLCVLALLIQRAVEIRTGDTWRNVSRELEALKVVRYRQESRTIVQRTGIKGNLAGILAKIGIAKPKKVLLIG